MMLQLNPAFTNNLIESVRAKMPALGMDLDASSQGHNGRCLSPYLSIRAKPTSTKQFGDI
jgi:hypothetical protein